MSSFRSFELNDQLLPIDLATVCEAYEKINTIVVLRPVTGPIMRKEPTKKRLRFVL